MTDYGRVLGLLCLGVLIAVSLCFQLLFAALAAGDGYFPVGMAIGVFTTILGGGRVVAVFLLGLPGGLRWSAHVAGWALVAHLTFYAFVFLAICDRVPAYEQDAVIRYPVPAAAVTIGLAIALAALLVRDGRPRAGPRDLRLWPSKRSPRV